MATAADNSHLYMDTIAAEENCVVKACECSVVIAAKKALLSASEALQTALYKLDYYYYCYY